MKRKFTLLIGVSIVALVALSAIQAYLIGNTYILKKKDFLRETDALVSKINDHELLDSLYFEGWGEDLALHISDYKNNRISKNEVLSRQKEKADSLNLLYTTIFEQELEALDLGFEVDYHRSLETIVVYENTTLDTIYHNTSQTPMVLFGTNFDHDEAVNNDNSRWYSEQEYITTQGDEVLTKTYDLEIRSANMMLIKDWRSIVLGRMAVLLIGSILLFFFVIGLLYYAIKGLIKQKKIADVKTDFINNITHELKTPLATLAVATKSLQTPALQNNATAFENTLAIIVRQNTRLQKLIDQVLSNSIHGARLVLHKESVVDNHFFNAVIQDFKLSHQHAQMTLIQEIYAPEVLLRIDRFHMTTALLNILENAVKYAKEDIVIKVNTKVKNNQYHIQIADNGIGISPKEQEAIFEKFHRVVDSNIHDVKGLGLGLYFTKQIIQAHHASIHLSSTLGQGSSFNIILPL
ncbi:MAG: two-component sensor histidine kinase [Cytophagaceae bacterium]|nr:two-component sensor histidine kinase [Cytophagaceae bacterium]